MPKMGQLILLPSVCNPLPSKKKKRTTTPPIAVVHDDGPSNSFLDDLETSCDEHEKQSTTFSSTCSSVTSVAMCQTAAEAFRMSRRRAESPTASVSSGSAMSSFAWWGHSSELSEGCARKRARQSVAIARCCVDSD